MTTFGLIRGVSLGFPYLVARRMNGASSKKVGVHLFISGIVISLLNVLF